VIFLKPGGDKRLGAGHPWVYSNEIRMDTAAKALAPGCLVRLARTDGKPLGLASFNPHALIAARLLSPEGNDKVDENFLAARLARALGLRQQLFADPFYRLVHAEADGLPGFVVDRYGETAVCQINTAGAENLLSPFLAALDRVVEPRTVILRADSRGRAAEGLDSYHRVLKGDASGPIQGREGGLHFAADPETGQKTGWFYDQRENRQFAAGLSAGGRVLDLYCHTGGFGLAAARAGAEIVLGVDSSAPALELAGQGAEMNGISGKCQFRKADVFKALDDFSADGQKFDLVVADPPAFVTARKDLNPGLRGYRKLAREAARLVAPGGFLLLASCSHQVEPTAFAKEVARGLASASRRGRILRQAGAGPDHPVHPHLPESAYLKVLVLQLD
jgi:23S rRNA (cytosine1962-C5)-methyltransferase